jgi:hypothetical protein
MSGQYDAVSASSNVLLCQEERKETIGLLTSK